MTDLLFPSDNEWGIPALAHEPIVGGPPGIAPPVVVWGSSRRSMVNVGTVCFYTDDYRFASVWRQPDAPLSAGAIVECNYSIFDDTPSAVALWAVYRKRWLSAYWQLHGCSVWVDLCVAARHATLNLLGIPRGWQRYATAGWDARVSELDNELAVARNQAAGYPFSLLVYGGGKAVTEWCNGRPEVIRVGHRSDARKRLGQGSRRKRCVD